MTKFTAELNDKALRQAIEGVEDNNRINDGRWSDWEDAQHVAETYGVELCGEGAKVIERAIASNGESLVEDGLSPLARGNPTTYQSDHLLPGPIPARTGQPPPPWRCRQR